MGLRVATAADLEAIMAIERRPGYEHLVGRSSADFHARVIDDPDHAYLVGLLDDGTVGGFGIVRDLTNAQGNTLLKRFAVAAPGKGFGKRLLGEITDWVFTNTRTHRFWLDHIITNDRARHVYEASGFRREGIFRQAYVLPDETRVDLAVMSILKPEWQAARQK
ncbi:MAG: acetyltransferase family protein [Rhizobium sp.]|nr:acetyltransferase family protein [Rhizobium sp.]